MILFRKDQHDRFRVHASRKKLQLEFLAALGDGSRVAMNRRRAAFTLFEIMLAIAIAVLLLALAIPSLSGIFADEDLRKSFDDFNRFVQQAQAQAIKEKRTVLLVWGKDGIETLAEKPEAADGDATGPGFAFPDHGSITLDRPAALEKKAPMEWAFWRSGACEPVRVYYESSAGKWVADYEPLTGRGMLVSTEPK